MDTTTALSVTVQALGNRTKGHKAKKLQNSSCLNHQFVKSFVLLCTISKVHTMGKLNNMPFIQEEYFLQLTIINYKFLIDAHTLYIL